MLIPNRIPQEIKQDIIDVINFIEPRLPICPAKQQTYLFDVYNKYIKPPYLDDEKQTCGGCRSLVIGKLRTIVREWKKQEVNS
jgi:hypothetical protein